MLPRYVRPSGLRSAKPTRGIQGKGKTPREVLKRIDYGGIITTLIWVRGSLDVRSIQQSWPPQVFATLLFLSYRYNEQLPVSEIHLFPAISPKN